nr:reverse transcriptase domain-containing protein [Tanacetum cinerariifolium]
IANPRGDLKEITTRSGVSYDGPPIPPPVVEREPEATKDKVQPTCPKSTTHVQPPVIQTQILNDEHVVAPKPKPSIPYPSRLNKQKLREKDDSQMLKFLQIFRSIHFDLPFADALLYMSKFAATFKSLLNNKENIFELANTPLNENCSVVLLKKLPEKLGDPDKPIGVAEDVFVKVGTFHFSADFVVVDYNVDPRVPLIIGRTFLRTAHALIDVHGEVLMLRFNDEAITFTVGQTSRYSSKSDESINRIDVIDEACKKYAQEVLGFSDNSKSGNPTPLSDPIITLSSHSLTSFEGGDFILEEIEACLASKSIPPGIDDTDFDPEGDIRLLEKLLNDDLE